MPNSNGYSHIYIVAIGIYIPLYGYYCHYIYIWNSNGQNTYVPIVIIGIYISLPGQRGGHRRARRTPGSPAGRSGATVRGAQRRTLGKGTSSNML